MGRRRGGHPPSLRTPIIQSWPSIRVVWALSLYTRSGMVAVWTLRMYRDPLSRCGPSRYDSGVDPLSRMDERVACST